MKIYPIESVQYLRPYSCDFRSDCSKCDAYRRDCHFPNPYNATDKELESVPYITEVWSDGDGLIDYDFDTQRIVVTFAELLDDFNNWNQSADPLMSNDERYDSVYDWIRECIDNGLHPCRIL